MIGRSAYKSAGWREALVARCEGLGLDAVVVRAETDGSDLMEGLYVKVEEGGEVAHQLQVVLLACFGHH